MDYHFTVVINNREILIDIATRIFRTFIVIYKIPIRKFYKKAQIQTVRQKTTVQNNKSNDPLLNLK